MQAPSGDSAPRVLIVEDDPGNALVMKSILAKLGRMAVEVTEDGDEVLSRVAVGDVDVIVMDVSLANTRVGGDPVDGLELTRRVKGLAAGGRPPAVLLATAHAMRGDAERFLESSGADGYLAKPIVDHDAFIREVRKAASVRRGPP